MILQTSIERRKTSLTDILHNDSTQHRKQKRIKKKHNTQIQIAKQRKEAIKKQQQNENIQHLQELPCFEKEKSKLSQTKSTSVRKKKSLFLKTTTKKQTHHPNEKSFKVGTSIFFTRKSTGKIEKAKIISIFQPTSARQEILYTVICNDKTIETIQENSFLKYPKKKKKKKKKKQNKKKMDKIHNGQTQISSCSL